MKPRGFFYFPDFITSLEEKNLLENIKTLDWKEVIMYGVVAKRKVVHFGLNYTYDNRQVTPTTPAPNFLKPFIDRAATTMKVKSDAIAEILITEYPVGSAIGWHKDAKIFGEKILGISLGANCIMKLRIKRDTEYEVVKKNLEPRSAYILSDEARFLWQHSISPLKQPRYSITFRTLK